MNALLRIPMFGYSLLVFVVVGLIAAVACWLAFRSGEQGSTKLSAPAGCAIGCGLFAFALLGAAGLVVVCFVDARAEALRHGPFRRLELHMDRDDDGDGDAWAEETPEPGESESTTEPASGYRARVILELRGSATSADVAKFTGHVSRWLNENLDGDYSMSTTTRDDGGTQFTRVEWGISIHGEELRELQTELERELDGFEIPDGLDVEVEVKEPQE